MSLTIISGRSGSGKTTRLLRELEKSLGKCADINKKKYVIVPDQFSYTMEKKVLDTFGEKNIFNISIMGFKMLSVRVLERVGGIKKKILSPIGREMIISHVQNLVNEDLTIYKGMKNSKGFSSKVSQMIKEFKNYDLTSEDLIKRAEGLKDSDVKRKLLDLALIYETYQNQISGKFTDGEDQLKLAVEKIKDAEFLRGCQFFIDEFSDFTPMQLNMIRELMKVGDVYITLTLDKNLASHKGVFTLPLETENQLINLAKETNVRLEKPIFIEGDYGRFAVSKRNDELRHIENEFYNYPNKVYNDEVKSVRIFKASNKYEEIEFVAKDILRRVRDEKLRFRDMAILLRDLPGYESILRSVMSEYEIPTFIDSRKEISTNPLSGLISAIFEVYKQNYSYESIFKMLKTGLYDVGYDEEEEYGIIEKFENYCLANGIKGYKWKEEQWNYQVPYVRDLLEEKQELNIINEVKDFIYEPLEKLYKNLEEAVDTRKMASIFYNFLIDIGSLSRYGIWIERFKDNEEFEQFKEYSQIEEALMEVLDQLSQGFSTDKLSIEEFGEVLLVGLNSIKISLIPATLDQVIAGDIARVRSSNVKGIYIVGTNEQVLPRTPQNNGLLTDTDRDRLREENINLSKNARERAFFEQFYVYNALTIASEFLTVTYPASDNDGKAMRPSMVIGRLKKLFPQLMEESSESYLGRKSRTLEDISSEKDALRELTAEMRRHRDAKPVDEIWKEVYSHFINSDKYKDKVKSSEEGLRYTNYPKELKAENVDKLYGNKLNFTVTRLENYTQCPFSYFIKYGIKAKERKEYKLETPDLGSLMHEVIDGFSRELVASSKDWKDVDEAYTDKKVEEIMNQALLNKANPILNSTTRYKYISTKVKRVIKTSVNTIKAQLEVGEFIPKFTELQFGENQVMPPVVLSLDNGKTVSLNGKIDRVDVYHDELTNENYIRIIDYKSSEKDLSLDDIYYGLQMQLLLYLDVVLKNSKAIMDGAAVPGAMLYFKLEKPLINTPIDTEDEELKKKIMAMLKLKGILLADAKIIRAMDGQMSGVSLVIPAKSDSKTQEVKPASQQEDRFITREQFKKIRDYMNDKIKEISKELLDGNISITPYKKDNKVACTYCKYKSICQFDTTIEGNEYNVLHKLDNDEVWKRIGGENW